MRVEGFVPREGQDIFVAGEEKLYLYSPPNRDTAAEKWNKAFKVCSIILFCKHFSDSI